MNRSRALIISLAIGLAAVAGVFALGNTLALGNQAHASADTQVARRTAQLNRYEASLRKALAQKTPALPPVPTAATAGPSTSSPVSASAARHGPDTGDLSPPSARRRGSASFRRRARGRARRSRTG